MLIDSFGFLGFVGGVGGWEVRKGAEEGGCVIGLVGVDFGSFGGLAAVLMYFFF